LGAGPRLRRRVILSGLAAWLAAPAAAAAATAGFPRRSVRLVVPYAVGIGPDVVARSLAERLAQRWGQAVVVDNKPGASGIVAFGEVRRTPADGHTLFLADTATLALHPLIHASLPYDPDIDLVPLSLLFRATFVLWVGGESRFATLGDLLQAARREPGRVSYASLGNGHASHVAIESFARTAGIRMLHVPFKDAGSLLTAVAAGDVDLAVFSINSVAGLMTQGRLRALAVAARERLAGHPLIPTLPQAGGPALEMHPWAALVAVAGTPPPVLEQLHADLVAALDATELRSRAEQAGFEITPSTPQAVRDRVAADRALYLPLIGEGRLTRI
jgi:tripartite-type tricarboxylate transporter receptor subunit TctC